MNYARVLRILEKRFGSVKPGGGNAFQTLIAAVLSARTKDAQTGKASSALFAKYPTAKKLSKAPLATIRKLIKPSNFYITKAKRVKKIAKTIETQFKGKVPRSMEALTSLPGVGRKTAGIVLVYSFGVPAIPVDVHVWRISNRLGWVKAKTPEQAEKQLAARVPKRLWLGLNDALVSFGQQVCKPRKPECWRCPVVKFCKFPRKNLDAPRTQAVSRLCAVQKTKAFFALTAS